MVLQEEIEKKKQQKKPQKTQNKVARFVPSKYTVLKFGL